MKRLIYIISVIKSSCKFSLHIPFWTFTNGVLSIIKRWFEIGALESNVYISKIQNIHVPIRISFVICWPVCLIDWSYGNHRCTNRSHTWNPCSNMCWIFNCRSFICHNPFCPIQTAPCRHHKLVATVSRTFRSWCRSHIRIPWYTHLACTSKLVYSTGIPSYQANNLIRQFWFHFLIFVQQCGLVQ